MKLSFSFFALVVAAFANNSGTSALDCSAATSRTIDNNSSGSSPICLHFGGIEPQGYHAWYNANGISARYPNFVYIPGSDPAAPENGVAVHWNVDGDYVNIAVAARATGWASFGIAEAGGMLGADMVIFTAEKPNELVDAFTDNTRIPQIDDCSNDWELVDSNVDTDRGFIMFETRRLLNTNDPQDRAIVNDASTLVPPHRVIAAWGDTPALGYHGLNRARGAIRFFGEGDDEATFRAAMDRDAEGAFEVRSINHEIAAMETEYAYHCLGRQEIVSEQGVLDTEDKLNIIGFEPILLEETEAYVHHFIVYASQEADCNAADDFFGEIAYVWAPGEGPLALPDYLGSPMFGQTGYQSFRIEVHYNNPKLTPGIIDNSGVRLYWTSQPREHEVGILSVGDPNVGFYGQQVGEGLSIHEFECPGSCSSAAASEPVTVLREYLHMHKEGTRIVNEQLRNGDVVRFASVDYWEFDQNGNAAVQQDPFVVQPGDGFRTSCYFDGNDDTVFGLSSSEEMCMAFLYYYPRVSVPVPLSEFVEGAEGTIDFPWMCGYDLGVSICEATHKTESLSSEAELQRAFGEKTCSDDPSDTVSFSVDTTDDEESGGTSIMKNLFVTGVAMLSTWLVLS